MEEHGHSSKSKKKAGSGSNLEPKGGTSKNKKFQGKYFNYEKVSYKVVDYRLPKKKRNKAANKIKDLV